MALASQTIVLRGDQDEFHGEANASTALKPGYACELTSSGGIQPHSTRGGKGRRIFAKENYLLGGTIAGLLADGVTTYYDTTTNKRVLYHEAQKGDKINTVLMTGESVTKGDWAISYGNGRMCKAASSIILQNLADSTTLTSWTTEVAFSNGTATVPANTLKVGDRIRIRASVFVLAANGADTLALRLLIGSTALVTVPALNITNSDIAVIDFTMTIRTIGASGTFVGTGSYVFGPPASAAPLNNAVLSTAIDTTAAQSITIKATASASDPGNQVILKGFTVEQISAAGAAGAEPGGDVWGQFDETMDATSEDKFCAMVVI